MRTLASAPCFGKRIDKADALEKAIDGDEADDLEKAIDSMTASGPKPKSSKLPTQQDGDDDAIDAAFEALFGPTGGASDDSGESGSDNGSVDKSDDSGSEVSDVDSEENWGARAPGDASDFESDVEEAEDGTRKATRSSQHYRREGDKIFWRDQHIGAMTAWNVSTGCRCRIHSACRAPASTKWPHDNTLIDWLLSAINYNGDKIVEKGQHVQDAALRKAAAARR